MSHAFTMTEIAVVSVVVGSLAVFFVPRFAGAGEDTRHADAAMALQQIAGAFDRFRRSNGYWPPEIGAGRMPPEMRSSFREHNPFAGPTPIGGVFDYDNLPSESALIIAIRGSREHPLPGVSDAMMLDSLLDDGNLRTGNFRLLGDGYAYAFNRK